MKVAAGIARELAERKQKRKKEIRLEKQNRALAKGKAVDGEDAETDEEEDEGCMTIGGINGRVRV